MPTLLTLQIVDGFLRSFLRRIATEECFPADAPANEIVQMRLPFLNHRAIVFATLLAILFAASMAHSRAHAQDKRLPKRAGHINDFAEVLDVPTKERLEAIFEKLKDKIHFDFLVTTGEATRGAELYD